jgi:exonuclease III
MDFNNLKKRQRLIEWSKQQQSNILLIQETHFSQNIENKLILDFKGSLYQTYNYPPWSLLISNVYRGAFLLGESGT